MIQYIKQIKELYEELTPRIISRQRGQWVSPYKSYIDWPKMFSPIEMPTWMALRGMGMTPLYPQYPVGNYFVDFGNPKEKVAIECDGKEWHLDKSKDAKRDKVLLEMGWHIFRIDGASCHRICERYESRYEDDENERYDILSEYYTIVEGLIRSIGIFYFEYKDYYSFEMEINLAYKCLLTHISPIQYDTVESNLYNRFCDLQTKYYNYKDLLKHPI